jgi:hypothetical protein
MVSLVAFAEGLHELGRKQTHVMAEGRELAPDMMSTGAGLHPD